MKFTKMQGNGNDFIVIEDLNRELLGKESEIARKLCNRKFGIGADGILLVRNNKDSDIEMEIINSDGSYAAMCGNGIRCFAKYVYERNIVKNSKMKIMTGDGIKEAELFIKDEKVDKIKIFMGKEDYSPKNIPAKCEEEVINKVINIDDKEITINSVLMGVPHTVIFEDEALDINLGGKIEKYPLFPQGTNVNFCKVINNEEIEVRTWERGAGPTLGCGTGNCASVIIAKKLGYVRDNVTVKVPGGELKVELTEEGVYMIGNAEFICEGISYILWG